MHGSKPEGVILPSAERRLGNECQKKDQCRPNKWFHPDWRSYWNWLPILDRLCYRNIILHLLWLLHQGYSLKGKAMHPDEKKLKKLVFTLAEIFKNHFTTRLKPPKPLEAHNHEFRLPSAGNTQSDSNAWDPDQL
jgi:hypothetical protein